MDVTVQAELTLRTLLWSLKASESLADALPVRANTMTPLTGLSSRCTCIQTHIIDTHTLRWST
jgi:hypothetical protein